MCVRERESEGERGEGSYQDEEALVGKLLVVGDGGEHGQHQAAEHQQKTETHNHTQVSKPISKHTHTHTHTHTSEIRTVLG